MIATLLILVAHALDALTLLMASQRWGFSGESNPFAQAVFASGGIGAVLLLKAGGTAVLVGIVALARRLRLRHSRFLLFASAAGIVGAVANLTALVLV